MIDYDYLIKINSEKVINEKKVDFLALNIFHNRDYSFVNFHYKLLDSMKETLLESNMTISEEKYFELVNEDELISYLLWNVNTFSY